MIYIPLRSIRIWRTLINLSTHVDIYQATPVIEPWLFENLKVVWSGREPI
jgi:hypothetical protein